MLRTSCPTAAHGAAPALRRPLPAPEDTDRIGAALAAHLAPGDAVLLHGDLGAGKSALARACIRALLAEDGRAEDDIPSPSLTLVQVYDCARAEVWHVDLYRLAGEDGCVELGLVDALDDAICLVEWPDRLGALTPARRLDIALSMALARELGITGTPSFVIGDALAPGLIPRARLEALIEAARNGG